MFTHGSVNFHAIALIYSVLSCGVLFVSVFGLRLYCLGCFFQGLYVSVVSIPFLFVYFRSSTGDISLLGPLP